MNSYAPLFEPAGTLGIEAIKTEEEYLAALDRITELCDAEPDCPEGNELELLGMLVEAYEARV
jgi:HTH-type transcriptional regulator / antitoxin HigA